ncbi:MAG: hypothetical protein Q8779_02485 [Candidatus Phytoplasma stylosanthis]|uniref:hypothetical protein n=1 Tax=Candidatus Phytoplasma stylosanthis TaxID=2798314 RepID=UPI00293A7590|nr:hypothetical protein [Candidatus Phytoplasma stylosanthis]MDV3174402.1 hypothetical protein [Candidatus Phytoplasma stylosanthis]
MTAKIKWVCLFSWGCYFLFFLLLWGERKKREQLILLEVDSQSINLPSEKVKIQREPKQYLSASCQSSSSAIDDFYYQSLLPQKQGQIEELAVYYVYLGENTGMKEAMGWLNYHFPLYHFSHQFSYALYNASDQQKEVNFQFRIKEPPPFHFLLAFFEGGKREGKDDTYTLEDLKQMGNGETALYFFWSLNKPPLPSSFPFLPENYHLEIIYEQGTNFGGPSYLFIDKIIIKDIIKDKVVGVYPINQKIEEPFIIFNYDFELKFPFYNYQSEGYLWSTNHIRSLKKIDLYEKRTGQHRTLYYDVD